MYAVAPAVLCKNLVATRTQDKRLWIQIISIDIHKKKICGYGHGYRWKIKFYIHGHSKPEDVGYRQ